MAVGGEFVYEMFAATLPRGPHPRRVRPGQTYSRTDLGVPGSHNDVITTVTNKTVYVDVAC